MLLESRHPLLFVLQSTWTTPEEMLPGGVAVEVTASPETVLGRAAHVGLGVSGLLLAPLATRPTALSRPRRAGFLLAL